MSTSDTESSALARAEHERDYFAAIILAARSYFGVNETSYVVKMLDSATEHAASIVEARDAEKWDEGFATGSSRAMRHMSDEPHLSITAPNPYRTSNPQSGQAA